MQVELEVSYNMLGSEEKEEISWTAKGPQSLQQMEPILETLNDGVVIAVNPIRYFFVNTVFEENDRDSSQRDHRPRCAAVV